MSASLHLRQIFLLSLRWRPSLLKRPSSSKIIPSLRNVKCSVGYYLNRHMFISTKHLFLPWPSPSLISVKSTTSALGLFLVSSKEQKQLICTTGLSRAQTVLSIFMCVISSHSYSSPGRSAEDKIEAERDEGICPRLTS